MIIKSIAIASIPVDSDSLPKTSGIGIGWIICNINAFIIVGVLTHREAGGGRKEQIIPLPYHPITVLTNEWYEEPPFMDTS
jgi:hypothetical protein